MNATSNKISHLFIQNLHRLPRTRKLFQVIVRNSTQFDKLYENFNILSTPSFKKKVSFRINLCDNFQNLHHYKSRDAIFSHTSWLNVNFHCNLVTNLWSSRNLFQRFYVSYNDFDRVSEFITSSYEIAVKVQKNYVKSIRAWNGQTKYDPKAQKILHPEDLFTKNEWMFIFIQWSLFIYRSQKLASITVSLSGHTFEIH